jgi:hypothetical protein
MAEMKKNNYLEMDDSDSDFGFTFANEEEIIELNPEYSSLQEQVDDLKMRLHAVQKIFLPLLENLNKDNTKPMIKWPDRGPILEKQIKKMKALTNV